MARKIHVSVLRFLACIFAAFIAQRLLVLNGFAVVEPTLSISMSPTTSITTNAETFASATNTITVTTDNYTGFSLSLETSGNSTNLINTMDNTLVIPTITLGAGQTSKTSSEFGSEYGFSTDGINYYPVPSLNSAALLQTTSTSSLSGSTTNLTFGLRTDYTVMAGTYQNTFDIVAVVNLPQYSITYNANSSDAVSNMPTNVSTTISSTGTVDLSLTTPTRTNYSFLGWDTDNTVTSNPAYQPGDTITLEPTQANNTTLYAIWEYEAPPVVADYTETFENVQGSTASATTNLTTGGSGMSPSEFITKIFAYTNNTGRTISSITVEIVYSKGNQGATSGHLIGKLNYNGNEYSATPVSVPKGRVTNQSLSVAEFTNLNIPSSSNVSFTIGTDSDSFSAGITISSQTVTVTFAD